jgi:hypothetical protein
MARIKLNLRRLPLQLICGVVVGLIAASSSAMAQTCDQLKAEIANLRQTLASEQRALANCNSQPGTCSTGQINSHQQAIQIAQRELDVDLAKLPTACSPPPPPNFDHVTLQGIEVVQAIQDMPNSVTLIAGKTTWVRVYFGKLSGTRALMATLQAKRGSTTAILNSAAPITVNAAENLTTRRQNWNRSLNFAVPAAMMSSGTTIFTVDTLTDMSAAQKRIICDNCGTPTQVSFSNMPPLIIRAIGLTYQFQPTPSAPQQTANPRAVDYALLQSWLTRALPVAQVTFSQTTTAVNFSLVFGNTAQDCTQANAQLLAIRAGDIDAGTDERTHYLGLVSNQGGFMRGCAPFPLGVPVASGPSGAPGLGNAPSNAVGDTDASFADWYGGHELSHTFLRQHPNICGTPSPYDASFPYPNGQISDATEKSFAGLDVGDTTNGISLAVLWGATTFDIMTYCNQPDWPSAYTYEGIRHQLLIENPGFKTQGQVGRPSTGAMLVGPLVHVVAMLNLSKRTGSINYVTPVTRALPSSAPSSRAELIVRDAAEKELFRQSVAIHEMTDTQEREDRLALIDATIPFREDMAQIQLELDGAVVASYTNEPRTPPAISGLKFSPEPEAEGLVISWNAPPSSFGKVTFSVEADFGDNRWFTIAIGVAAPKLTLTSEQVKLRRLRVTANNGFRVSPSTVINLCWTFENRVAQLAARVEKLQEEIDSGELPSPPRTPQRMAPFLAQLRKLRHDLAIAENKLAQCRSVSP